MYRVGEGAEVRRSAHLAYPAASFATVGVVLLIFGNLPGLRLVGGLTTSGTYALALQVVLALFLLGGVDDLPQPLIAAASTRKIRRGSPDPGRPLFDMRRALARYYATRPLPAFFLALGFSMSLTTLLIGVLDIPSRQIELGSLMVVRWSEMASAVILALATLVQARRPGPGFLGWCPGFAIGTATTQLVFDPQADSGYTLLSWFTVVVLLSAVWVLAFVAAALRRRWSRTRAVESRGA
jgi:hypothetical protein